MIVFQSMLLLVYECFCEYTLFFRITLEVCVILHHANVFIEDNIYGIKVVPLTTLLVMKIGVSDTR